MMRLRGLSTSPLIGMRHMSKTRNKQMTRLNKLFDDFYTPSPFPQFGETSGLMPSSNAIFNPLLNLANLGVTPIAIDFYQTPKEYHLEADLPGIKKEEVKVLFDERHGILTLECHKESQIPEEDIKQGNVTYHKQERMIGKSTRTLKLPTDAEASFTKCIFADGVLKISIPRIEDHKQYEKQLEIEG